MLVVTGEPGAGKSALLGPFVVLADPVLSQIMDRAGLPMGPESSRPSSGAFDAVLHLTGKTGSDARRAIGYVVPDLDTASSVRPPNLANTPLTILVDALDEAQTPFEIIDEVLLPLARGRRTRLIVGTRRSLNEGPDMAAAPVAELLNVLGATDQNTMVLRREPNSMADYARQRLNEDGRLDGDMVVNIEGKVREIDQPFLFVRLAVYELLARVDDLDVDRINVILSGSHADLFGMAMDRLR